MIYLAHTANSQLAALWLSCVGWTLTATSLGLIQWRVWRVYDGEVITSSVAWVGLWRACFNSHTVVSPGFKVMHCRYIILTEAYTPPEIVAGQILMILSLVVGLCGHMGGVYSLRNIYFGIEKNSPIRLSFTITGALCLLAAVISLIPLLWNLGSVVTNQTINFPPEFKMPPAPDSQHVGYGIGVGLVGAGLLIVSGIIFCRYRLPAKLLSMTQPSMRNKSVTDHQRGQDNPTFELHEHL